MGITWVNQLLWSFSIAMLVITRGNLEVTMTTQCHNMPQKKIGILLRDNAAFGASLVHGHYQLIVFDCTIYHPLPVIVKYG